MHEPGLALHIIDRSSVQHTAVIPQHGIVTNGCIFLNITG
jgi:hypothetical protein